MVIGVDLLWVRVGKNGGTESAVRNILDGILQCTDGQNLYVLYVSADNAETFTRYLNNDKISLHVCKVKTEKQFNRVIWENINLIRMGKRDKVDVWFFPVYSRPFILSKKTKNVTVIHDLQGLHFPEYFSRFRMLFFRFAWYIDCKNSTRIVTISHFCKNDIASRYNIKRDKISVIYNSIGIDEKTMPFTHISIQYGITAGEYYYTVSSLAKHKNLITLLKAINIIKEKDKNVRLVISGVKINATNEIEDFIKNNDLSDNIIYTGFISNTVRNSLYMHCKKFVFSSIFEGFGMPPIEAMLYGCEVITTRMTSIPEITLGLCEYVDNPYDENEWANKMLTKGRKITEEERKQLSQLYDTQKIALQYIKMFEDSVSIDK